MVLACPVIRLQVAKAVAGVPDKPPTRPSLMVVEEERGQSVSPDALPHTRRQERQDKQVSNVHSTGSACSCMPVHSYGKHTWLCNG